MRNTASRKVTMFTLKKYTITLKISISTLLMITLLLSDFYAFGMQNEIPKYDVEQENGEALRYVAEAPTQHDREDDPEIRINIEALKRSQENSRQEMVVIDVPRQPRKMRSRPPMERGMRPLNSQQGHMSINARPNIETYQGGKRLTDNDFPLSCLELIFKFLISDDWNEIVDLMSNHTDFYLAGLTFLSKLCTEVNVQAPMGPLLRAESFFSGFPGKLDWDQLTKSGEILFRHHGTIEEKIERLVIAKNYLRALAKPHFRAITRKIKRKFEQVDLDELIDLVNERISERLTFVFFNGRATNAKTCLDRACDIKRRIKKMKRKKCCKKLEDDCKQHLPVIFWSGCIFLCCFIAPVLVAEFSL